LIVTPEGEGCVVKVSGVGACWHIDGMGKFVSCSYESNGRAVVPALSRQTLLHCEHFNFDSDELLFVVPYLNSHAVCCQQCIQVSGAIIADRVRMVDRAVWDEFVKRRQGKNIVSVEVQDG
jgi:hypothetical protein